MDQKDNALGQKQFCISTTDTACINLYEGVITSCTANILPVDAEISADFLTDCADMPSIASAVFG